jgi:hypothetical protein
MGRIAELKKRGPVLIGDWPDAFGPKSQRVAHMGYSGCVSGGDGNGDPILW